LFIARPFHTADLLPRAERNLRSVQALTREVDVKTALDSRTAARSIESRSPLHDILRRIECEYGEMPGMCVTAAQAQRLWGIDATTCSFVLTTLVERRILRKTPRGTYVKC
jgi:Fic family protein